MSAIVNDWIAPVFGIVGVIVGALISYYVQTKTERKTWKREYSAKIAETVYYSLYAEVKEIKSLLEKRKFELTSFGKWREFQKDHHYI